jgi:hypothetical protein
MSDPQSATGAVARPELTAQPIETPNAPAGLLPAIEAIELFFEPLKDLPIVALSVPVD